MVLRRRPPQAALDSCMLILALAKTREINVEWFREPNHTGTRSGTERRFATLFLKNGIWGGGTWNSVLIVLLRLMKMTNVLRSVSAPTTTEEIWTSLGWLSLVFPTMN
jgi:hypothetical protein